MTGQVLCAVADLADGSGRGFVFGAGTDRRAVFVIRRGSDVYAYENSCPHVGTPLDWVPDQFLDPDGSHILCGTHGALFRIEDGHCVSGPCAGDALRPVTVRVTDGRIVMLAPSNPSAEQDTQAG